MGFTGQMTQPTVSERKGKVKGGKDEEVNRQGGKRGAPSPHGAQHVQHVKGNYKNFTYSNIIEL